MKFLYGIYSYIYSYVENNNKKKSVVIIVVQSVRGVCYNNICVIRVTVGSKKCEFLLIFLFTLAISIYRRINLVYFRLTPAFFFCNKNLRVNIVLY